MKAKTTGNRKYEDTLPGVAHQRGASRRPFHARVRCWIQYGEQSSYWQTPFSGLTEDICHEGIFVVTVQGGSEFWQGGGCPGNFLIIPIIYKGGSTNRKICVAP